MQPDTFRFDISAKKTRFTRKQLIDGLRAFDQSRPPNLRGTPFRAKDFNAWPDHPFNSKIAAHRFGAWRFALAAAGMKGRFRGVYSAAELMDLIEQVWRKIERPPGRKALAEHTGLCGETFARRFGSIDHACRRLALYKEGKITRAQLLRPAPKYRAPTGKRLRWSILERDHHRCTACGKSAKDGVTLEVDHILPVSRGGQSIPDNLRTLCRDCNRGRSATTHPLPAIAGPRAKKAA
jgi:hypothetical protein